jgi:hypothetical protein
VIDSSAVTIVYASCSGSPVLSTPLAMTCTGRPLEAAMTSERLLPNPMSMLPLATPGTIAAPPWPALRSSSMPSSAKKPCSMPT